MLGKTGGYQESHRSECRMCAENDVRNGSDAGQRRFVLSHGKEKLNGGRVAEWLKPPRGDTAWIMFPDPLSLKVTGQNLVPIANASVTFSVDYFTTYKRIVNGVLLGIDEAALVFGNPTSAQGTTATYTTATSNQGYAQTGQVYAQWDDDWQADWDITAWVSAGSVAGMEFGLWMQKQPPMSPPGS
jgi:hypothetical protein